MTGKRCPGKFGAETIEQLRIAFANSETVLVGTCVLCHRRNVGARNDSGNWAPRSHTVPTPEKGTGKRGGK
jgi:hypothetical protein